MMATVVPRSFGVTAFCREMDVALADLSAALEKADALGLSSDARVVTGHTVHDYNTDFWTTKWFYVPGLQADACTKDTNEVKGATEGVRAAISAAGGAPPDSLRPDYTPSEGNPFNVIPWWVPALGIGYVLLKLGVHVPQRKLSGYARKKRRHR